MALLLLLFTGLLLVAGVMSLTTAQGDSIFIGCNKCSIEMSTFPAIDSSGDYLMVNGVKHLIIVESGVYRFDGNTEGGTIGVFIKERGKYLESTFHLSGAQKIANAGPMITTATVYINDESTFANKSTSVEFGAQGAFTVNSLHIKTEGSVSVVLGRDEQFGSASSVTVEHTGTESASFFFGHLTSKTTKFGANSLTVSTNSSSTVYLGYLEPLNGSESTESPLEHNCSVTEFGGTPVSQTTNVTIYINEVKTVNQKAGVYVGYNSAQSQSATTTVSLNSLQVEYTATDESLSTEVEPHKYNIAIGCALKEYDFGHSVSRVEINSATINISTRLNLNTNITIGSSHISPNVGNDEEEQNINFIHSTANFNNLKITQDNLSNKDAKTVVDLGRTSIPAGRHYTLKADVRVVENFSVSWLPGVITTSIRNSDGITLNTPISFADNQYFHINIGQIYERDPDGNESFFSDTSQSTVSVSIPTLTVLNLGAVTTSVKEKKDYNFPTLNIRKLSDTSTVTTSNVVFRLRDNSLSKTHFKALVFDLLEDFRPTFYVSSTTLFDFLNKEYAVKQANVLSILRVTRKYFCDHLTGVAQEECKKKAKVGVLDSPYDSLTVLANYARHDFCIHEFESPVLFSLFGTPVTGEGGSDVYRFNRESVTHSALADAVTEIIKTSIDNSNFHNVPTSISTSLFKHLTHVTPRTRGNRDCPVIDSFVTSEDVLGIAQKRGQPLFPFYGGIPLSCSLSKAHVFKYDARGRETNPTGKPVEIKELESGYGLLSGYTGAEDETLKRQDVEVLLSFPDNEYVYSLLNNITPPSTHSEVYTTTPDICEYFQGAMEHPSQAFIYVNPVTSLSVSILNPHPTLKFIQHSFFNTELSVCGNEGWSIEDVTIIKDDDFPNQVSGWHTLSFCNKITIDLLSIEDLDLHGDGSSLSIMSSYRTANVSVLDSCALNAGCSIVLGAREKSGFDNKSEVDIISIDNPGKHISVLFGSSKTNNGVIDIPFYSKSLTLSMSDTEGVRGLADVGNMIIKMFGGAGVNSLFFNVTCTSKLAFNSIKFVGASKIGVECDDNNDNKAIIELSNVYMDRRENVTFDNFVEAKLKNVGLVNLSDSGKGRLLFTNINHAAGTPAFILRHENTTAASTYTNFVAGTSQKLQYYYGSQSTPDNFCVLPDPEEVFSVCDSDSSVWCPDRLLTSRGLSVTTIDKISKIGDSCQAIIKVCEPPKQTNFVLGSKSQKRINVKLTGVHLYPVSHMLLNDLPVKGEIRGYLPPDNIQTGQLYDVDTVSDYTDKHKANGEFTIVLYVESPPAEWETLSSLTLKVYLAKHDSPITITFKLSPDTIPKCTTAEASYTTGCEHLVSSATYVDTDGHLKVGLLDSDVTIWSHTKFSVIPLASRAGTSLDYTYLKLGPYEVPLAPFVSLSFSITYIDSKGGSDITCNLTDVPLQEPTIQKMSYVNSDSCLNEIRKTLQDQGRNIFDGKLKLLTTIVTDSGKSITRTNEYKILPAAHIIGVSKSIDEYENETHVAIEFNMEWDGVAGLTNCPNGLLVGYKFDDTNKLESLICHSKFLDGTEGEFKCGERRMLMSLDFGVYGNIYYWVERSGPLLLKPKEWDTTLTKQRFIISVVCAEETLGDTQSISQYTITSVSLDTGNKQYCSTYQSGLKLPDTGGSAERGPIECHHTVSAISGSDNKLLTVVCDGISVAQTASQLSCVSLSINTDKWTIRRRLFREDIKRFVPLMVDVGVCTVYTDGQCSNFAVASTLVGTIQISDLTKTNIGVVTDIGTQETQSIQFTSEQQHNTGGGQTPKYVTAVLGVTGLQGNIPNVAFFHQVDFEGLFRGDTEATIRVSDIFKIEGVPNAGKTIPVSRSSLMCEMSGDRCVFAWPGPLNQLVVLDVGGRFSNTPLKDIYSAIGKGDGLDNKPSFQLGARVTVSQQPILSIQISNAGTGETCEVSPESLGSGAVQTVGNSFSFVIFLPNHITGGSNQPAVTHQCGSILSLNTVGGIETSSTLVEVREFKIMLKTTKDMCDVNSDGVSCLLLPLQLALFTERPSANPVGVRSYKFTDPGGQATLLGNGRTIITSAASISLDINSCFNFAYKILVDVADVSSEFGIAGSPTGVRPVVANYLPLQHPSTTSPTPTPTPTSLVEIPIPSDIQRGIFRVSVVPLNIFHTAMLSPAEYNSGEVLITTNTHPDSGGADASILTGLTIFYDSASLVPQWQVTALGQSAESTVSVVYGSSLPLSLAGLQVGLGVSGVKTISVLLGDILVTERHFDFTPPSKRDDTYRLVLLDDLAKGLVGLAGQGETVTVSLDVTIKTFAELSSTNHVMLAVLYVTDNGKPEKPQMQTSRKPFGDPATFHINADNSLTVRLGGRCGELATGFSYVVTVLSPSPASSPSSSMSLSPSPSLSPAGVAAGGSGEGREMTLDEAFVRQHVASSGDELVFDVDVSFWVGGSAATASFHVQYRAACQPEYVFGINGVCKPRFPLAAVLGAVGGVAAAGLVAGLAVVLRRRHKRLVAERDGRRLEVDIDADALDLCHQAAEEAAAAERESRQHAPPSVSAQDIVLYHETSARSPSSCTVETTVFLSNTSDTSSGL